jgi:large subunit ribosomal protein L15
MSIGLDSLAPAKGAKHNKKRKGRGRGSGKGRSCARGRKGSGHRAGYSQNPGFEGGQMPLVRRTPKRGFSNAVFASECEAVNINRIQDKYKSQETVSPQTLKEKGLIKGKHRVKILGSGELKKQIKVSGCLVSSGAREKIEKAGGEIR